MQIWQNLFSCNIQFGQKSVRRNAERLALCKVWPQDEKENHFNYPLLNGKHHISHQ